MEGCCVAGAGAGGKYIRCYFTFGFILSFFLDGHIIAEPLGLATQGNLDFGSFCYMYKQRFSQATLVIARIKSKEIRARHKNKSKCKDMFFNFLPT
jgi:hypothetical protein